MLLHKEARGPRAITQKPQGPSAAIGDVRSELMTFCRLALGGLSRTVGLGLGFEETSRGAEVLGTM